MTVNPIAGPTPVTPGPTREEMIAIAASRPAALAQQQVALAAADRGTSGQGTPAVDPNAEVDLYA
jgi:hypothetical protein